MLSGFCAVVSAKSIFLGTDTLQLEQSRNISKMSSMQPIDPVIKGLIINQNATAWLYRSSETSQYFAQLPDHIAGSTSIPYSIDDRGPYTMQYLDDITQDKHVTGSGSGCSFILRYDASTNKLDVSRFKIVGDPLHDDTGIQVECNVEKAKNNDAVDLGILVVGS